MLPDAWAGRFCVAPWPARWWNWRQAVAGSATSNQGAGMRSRSVPRSAYPNLVRLDHGSAARCRFGVARLRAFSVRFRALPSTQAHSLPMTASSSPRRSSSCRRPSFLRAEASFRSRADPGHAGGSAGRRISMVPGSTALELRLDCGRELVAG